jgi:hypothetical protein
VVIGPSAWGRWFGEGVRGFSVWGVGWRWFVGPAWAVGGNKAWRAQRGRVGDCRLPWYGVAHGFGIEGVAGGGYEIGGIGGFGEEDLRFVRLLRGVGALRVRAKDVPQVFGSPRPLVPPGL